MTGIELRSDGLHISGYVNVPLRESRPILTGRGKVNEIIEQRAFQRAIDRAVKIDLLVDHNRPIASTENGTLQVREDNVGLRAEAVVTDEEAIAAAKSGKVRGWSFNMFNVKDEVEERAGKLPLRTVKDFDMNEVSLIIHMNPCYSSTSFETRAETEEMVEYRGTEENFEVKTTSKKIDYSPFEERLNKL